MARRLNIAPEAALMLPAAHLAQLTEDVDNTDNRCLICGELIEGPVAELVVLHDDRAILARMAHPACTVSGAYAWDRTSDAIAALVGQMDGLDVATALAWRRTGSPRALVLAEPRIAVSAEGASDDPLERMFADPLGLYPAGGPLGSLTAPPSPTARIEISDDGVRVVSERLRLTVPSDRDTLNAWSQQAAGQALLIVGRGLGLNRDDQPLQRSLQDALRARPTWAAVITVQPPSGS